MPERRLMMIPPGHPVATGFVKRADGTVDSWIGLWDPQTASLRFHSRSEETTELREGDSLNVMYRHHAPIQSHYEEWGDDA